VDRPSVKVPSRYENRRLSCVLAKCGDDVVDTGEQCDGAGSAAACKADCTLPVCGDGTVDPGEECDLGTMNSDTLPNGCRTTCKEAFCGDGVVDTSEQCDDGLTPETCQSCALVVGSGGSAGSGAGGGAGALVAGGPGAGGTAGMGGARLKDDALERDETGGCGCRVPSRRPTRGALSAALALGLGLLARRRSGRRVALRR
jgi:hypothetical protein